MASLTLEEWRRAKNKSQEDMAEALGVHPNTYRNMEKHPETITVARAYLAAKFLGVDFDEIIFLPFNTTKCSN